MNWIIIRKDRLADLQAAEDAYENASTVLFSAHKVEDLLERAGTSIIEDRPGRALQLVEEARKLVRSS